MSLNLFVFLIFGFIAVSFANTVQPSHHGDHKHEHDHDKNSAHMMTMEKEKVPKVNISVYYEALCGDSAAFITKQLYPLLTKQNYTLPNYMNVTYIPFGKSSITTENETVTFECHHGPEECIGNKYQACAIKHIENKSHLDKYINCTMATGFLHKNTSYSVGKTCAEELKVDFPTLETCASGPEGIELLTKYGKITKDLKPALSNVPSVVFNDEFNNDKHTEAIKNLKSSVCKEIKNSASIIPECAESKNGAQSILTASFITMGVTMVITRLY